MKKAKVSAVQTVNPQSAQERKGQAQVQAEAQPQAHAMRSDREESKRVLIRAYGAGVIRCNPGARIGDFYTSAGA